MSGVVQHLQPTQRNLAPAPGCPDDRPRQADREIVGAVRTEGHRRCRKRPLVVGCRCVEERRLGESTNQPVEIDPADAGVHWMRVTKGEVREAGCVVAEDECVVDSWSPPFVLRAEPEGYPSDISQHRRLAWTQTPTRPVTEAERHVQRIGAVGVPRKRELAAIWRNRW